MQEKDKRISISTNPSSSWSLCQQSKQGFYLFHRRNLTNLKDIQYVYDDLVLENFSSFFAVPWIISKAWDSGLLSRLELDWWCWSVGRGKLKSFFVRDNVRGRSQDHSCKVSLLPSLKCMSFLRRPLAKLWVDKNLCDELTT